MSIVTWDVPFVLTSKYGTLNLNAATGNRYLLDPGRCSSGADLRVQIDNIPSGDGAIMHDIFTAGYGVNLYIQLWKEDALACGTDLVSMFDSLQFHLNAMRHDTGRITWTPPGHAQRMVDQIRLTQRAIVELDGDNVRCNVGCDFYSPFPYAMVAAQTTTTIAAGASATLFNTGTADFYPVMKVHGPTSGGFVVRNVTTGLEVVYDPTLPGAGEIPGGSYVELDFFRDTAYLNGSGANEKKAIQIVDSDFFPITVEPLGNQISLTGGTSVDILWQPAFA